MEFFFFFTVWVNRNINVHKFIVISMKYHYLNSIVYSEKILTHSSIQLVFIDQS
jgi:hypothetical protein